MQIALLLWQLTLITSSNEPDLPSLAPDVLFSCDNTEISIAHECPGDTGIGISWAEYADKLYLARSELFATDISEAVSAVHRLLTEVTETFSNTFACTPALIATYFSLAHLLALQGRVRRALAFLQMGFIFVRDRGFSECTPWPVQGYDMMLAGKGLVAVVRNLDDESVMHVPAGHRDPSLRVAIVTICAYATDEPVRLLCAENRQLYSMLHGYDLHFFTNASEILPHVAARMNVSDGVHKPFFWKVNAVKNVLDTGKYDWVLWMDCDAFFMDPLRTIDSVITMYSGNLTAPTRRLPPPAIGESERTAQLRRRMSPDPAANISLIFAVDSTGINNGVWLLRNSPWSHVFLSRWWHTNILDGPGREHNCSDQSTMLHTLLHDSAMQLDRDWDEVEGPIWPPEVRVAPQEHLQSFHEGTAMTAMSRAWVEGDYIKHHPGCHYYKVQCQYLYSEAEAHFVSKVQTL